MLICAFVTALLTVQQSAPPAGQFIYETASFPSAHASTVAETSDGLVTAWFGGTREGAADVGIWVSRRANGAWTPPVEVATGVQADGTRHPCWNPVLFVGSDNTLTLFYKVGPTPRTWWGMVRTSRDNGRTWTEGRRLPDGILGPIKNKPVRLADGTLLSGSSTETDERPSTWRVHFEWSTDGGATWTRVAPPASAGANQIDAIQPSILIHQDGRLQAVGRTRSGRVFETWSSDGGRTWTPLSLIALPNPSAGTDAVTLRDGRHLIVYNHTAQGRSPLNVAISRDGKTWDAALVLESEPGEYSYPAVIQTADGKVHFTYTWKRQRIKHVEIDPAQLKPVPMVDGTWPREAKDEIVSEKPDFSGLWVFAGSDSGADVPRALTIRQSPRPVFREIAIDREFESVTRSATHTIGIVGGVVSGVRADGISEKGPRGLHAVKWDGRALVFEAGSYAGEARQPGAWSERREVWLIDPDGRLRVTIVTAASAGRPSTVTLMYQRKS